VLFSFIVYRVHIARETTRGPFRFPQWAWTFLIVLIAFLCNLRHNAVLFYVLIPLLFYSAITRYDFIKISMICTICFLVTQLVIPAMFGIQKTKGSPYHQMRTSVLLATHYNFFSDNRTRDMRIIEDAARIPWQKINELFPNKWFILWDSCEPKRRQWQPERGDTREYNAAFVARLISQNIPAFVASRTYEFCHSLGIDTSFSDERNAFYENPLQLHGTNLAPPGKYLFDVVIHAKRKVPAWLGDALDGYANWSRIFDSIVSPQVIVWNLVIFVFLFIVILIVSPGFSSIQFFIYPSACAALTIFLVGAGESWRYFYYIYLAGLVVVPLYLSYLKVRKQS